MRPALAFNLQFISTLIFFWFVTKEYVLPLIQTKGTRKVLMLLVAPHLLRTVGVIYLVAGTVGIATNLPVSFLYPTGYGDLTAAALATIALIALKRSYKSAYVLTWIFNIVGSLDLVLAMANGIRIQFLNYQVGPA